MLSGCGGGDNPPPENPPSESGSTDTPPAEMQPDEDPPAENPPEDPPSQDPPATGFPQAFDTNVSYQRTLYVSSSASPGGDGSAAMPFDNIRAALLDASPGTLINIAAGNYGPVGAISNLHGNATAPIALVANGQVIIDGAGSSMAMHLTDARYFVMDGITVQNTFPHGMNIDDGSSYDTPSEYIVLRNMHFRDSGNGGNNDCLKLSGVDNFYIEYSEFENCNAGEAIDMVGSHDGVITSNYFHDLPVNAMNTKGGSANILIHGNRFEDIGQRAINAGGSTGTPYFRPINATYEGSQIQIVANIFVRIGSAPVAYVGCDTCVFANNTIIEPQRYIARILEENTSRTPGGNGYFMNNIIVFNTSQVTSFVNVGANTNPATYTFGWNLWYAMDNPNFSGPVYGGGVPPETNAIIQQDPNLSASYRTQSGSPAFDQGNASVPRGVVGDYDRRAYNDPPAIGAFAAP